MIINTIIIIWFLIWIYKTFPSKSVKTYLKKLLNNHKYGFAKLQFDIFAMKEDRETLRKEMDKLIEAQDAYQLQVDNKENKEETLDFFVKKVEQTKNSLEEIKKAIDEKDLNITVYEKQMDDLNNQKKILIDYIRRM